MSWTAELLISVTAGVSVAAIVAAARAVWIRRRVPIALSQAVIRRHYVEQILALSTAETVTSLDALSPRFTPRGEDSQISSLQDAWAAINRRGRVRVVIGNADEAITGGAELVSKGWNTSTPLESVIAEQAILRAGTDADASVVCQALRDRSLLYRLDDKVRAAVAQHSAFRHSSSIIFIVGLPGSGKSFTRRRLAERLGALRIRTQELTDYVFAYRDFIHGSIKLAPPRGMGFEPDLAGAFKVSEENHLRPALSSLASRVLSSVGSQEVTLVEFARSDILAALQEFGEETVKRSQVIYVDAHEKLRQERLHRRERPPELAVSGAVTITVTVSDDHRLPSAAQKSIYGLDDITVLRSDLRWRGRVFTIVNDADHSPQFETALDEFIAQVTLPYMTSHR